MSFRLYGPARFSLEASPPSSRVIVLRNGLGWEMRYVSPKSGGVANIAGPGPSRVTSKMWRWDLFNPEGALVASEPSVKSALATFTRLFVGNSPLDSQ